MGESVRRQGRRRFLGTLGAAAGAAVAAAHPAVVGTARAEGADPRAQHVSTDRFGRMFPELSPFASASPELHEALLDIGKLGGVMDARDDLAKGPILLITDSALSLNNPNNTTHTAGTTFLGQFIDHDLTFDTTSRLGVPKHASTAVNARTPAFDLDSVYGRGPVIDPHLYAPSDPVKLKVESGGFFEDLPRTADRLAIIGDPRNDEHIIIAGLHAAVLKFHNRIVDWVRSEGPVEDVFGRARQLTAWHYQWIVLHEFLPQIIGQSLVDDILSRGPQFFRPSESGYMPVEFQGAAYRFGHSIVRPSYRANLKGNADGTPFFGLVFDHSQNGKADPDDLRGGTRAPRRFIGWQTFFRFDDAAAAAEAKPNKKIDTRISTPLFMLTPGTIAGADQTPISLPARNLLRQVTWGIPSGQSVARSMGGPVLSKADFKELAGYGRLSLDESTPLWYYVLKEAELLGDGERLGPVGGRIVGEVFIGLLRADTSSFLSGARDWEPTLPSGVPGGFRMVDLLTFAEVDPRSRGQ